MLKPSRRQHRTPESSTCFSAQRTFLEGHAAHVHSSVASSTGPAMHEKFMANCDADVAGGLHTRILTCGGKWAVYARQG